LESTTSGTLVVRWPSVPQTGAAFVRCVAAGAWESDMGLWQTDAAWLLRERRRLEVDTMAIIVNVTPEFRIADRRAQRSRDRALSRRLEHPGRDLDIGSNGRIGA